MDVFEVLRNGKLEVYHNYDDIPLDFDNLIRFEPEPLPEQHSEEDHEYAELWNTKLQRLMEIERASSNKNR